MSSFLFLFELRAPLFPWLDPRPTQARPMRLPRSRGRLAGRRRIGPGPSGGRDRTVEPEEKDRARSEYLDAKNPFFRRKMARNEKTRAQAAKNNTKCAACAHILSYFCGFALNFLISGRAFKRKNVNFGAKEAKNCTFFSFECAPDTKICVRKMPKSQRIERRRQFSLFLCVCANNILVSAGG